MGARRRSVIIKSSAIDSGTGDFEGSVEALKALANPTRLRIMIWLQDPHEQFEQWEPIADRDEFGVCVSHLQAKSGLAQSTVSSYMATLERAGLVRSTRIGKWTHYKRNDDMVAGLAEMLRGTK